MNTAKPLKRIIIVLDVRLIVQYRDWGRSVQ